MLEDVKSSILRGDVVTVAAGLLIALAAFKLIETIVGSLITPLIAVFVGDPVFSLNSFTINSVEFAHGFAIVAAITFVLTAAFAYLLLSLARSRGR
jgi:large conductance mechanosensitive channel